MRSDSESKRVISVFTSECYTCFPANCMHSPTTLSSYAVIIFLNCKCHPRDGHSCSCQIRFQWSKYTSVTKIHDSSQTVNSVLCHISQPFYKKTWNWNWRNLTSLSCAKIRYIQKQKHTYMYILLWVRGRDRRPDINKYAYTYTIYKYINIEI